MFEIILEIPVLALALSIDAFASGFTCGISHTRIPPVSVLILSSISSLTLAASLLTGNFLGRFLPPFLANDLSFLILFLLGLFKFFDKSGKHRAEKANKDNDDLLSPGEAVPLGAALSMDSAAAGIGAGVFPARLLLTSAVSFLMGVGAILGGSLLGRKLSRRTDKNLSWISGVLLILLAFFKLF